MKYYWKYIPHKTENNQDGDKLVRDKLFKKLKDAIKSRRPKNCSSVIEEIENFSLSSRDRKIFTEIKELVKRYRF